MTFEDSRVHSRALLPTTWSSGLVKPVFKSLTSFEQLLIQNSAQSMLKLCTKKTFDDLLTPAEFNRLAFVAQDRLAAVRRGFVEKLQKYLVKGRLSNRFYTIIFLTAFEPELEFKNSIITWIRSRAKVLAEKKSMESIFARVLSLLAQCVSPDFDIFGL